MVASALPGEAYLSRLENACAKPFALAGSEGYSTELVLWDSCQRSLACSWHDSWLLRTCIMAVPARREKGAIGLDLVPRGFTSLSSCRGRVLLAE